MSYERREDIIRRLDTLELRKVVEPLSNTPSSEHLANALTIADLGQQGLVSAEQSTAAFGDIARLIRAALPSVVHPVSP